MIVGVIGGLLFGRLGYYLSLLWCCVAIFVFMVGHRLLLCLHIVSNVNGECPHCECDRFPPPRSQIRTLRLKLLSEAAAEGKLVRGARNQLRMYLTMSIAAAQPVFMYWLTYHLVR